MQPQGRREFVRLVKIKGFDCLLNVLPELFPRVTFGNDRLGQTFRAVTAVGFLNHFEDQFSHVHKSKRPMPEQQVPGIRTAHVQWNQGNRGTSERPNQRDTKAGM